MSITLNISADNTDLLHLELMKVLFPADNTREAVYDFLAKRAIGVLVDPETAAAMPVNEPGNVVPMGATAGGPPKRRRGKGNGAPAARMMTQEEAEAEDMAEALKQEDEELAALAPDRLSRDQVIERLTLIFKGADAGTRAKIKDWRTKMGYSLIRDMTDADVPSALKLIDDLVAAAG